MAMNPDTLLRGRDHGGWLSLQSAEHTQARVPLDLLPDGDGLVSSGGSSGGRQICLQPWSHLDQSAQATACWLEQISLALAALHLQPIAVAPCQWAYALVAQSLLGCMSSSVASPLMKQPQDLLRFCGITAMELNSNGGVVGTDAVASTPCPSGRCDLVAGL